MLPSLWATGPQSILCVHLRCVQHIKTSHGLLAAVVKNTHGSSNTTQLEDEILMIWLCFLFLLADLIIGLLFWTLRCKQNLHNKQDTSEQDSTE